MSKEPTLSLRRWPTRPGQRSLVIRVSYPSESPSHLDEDLLVHCCCFRFVTLRHVAAQALEALSLVAPADTDARRALAGLTRQK